MFLKIWSFFISVNIEDVAQNNKKKKKEKMQEIVEPVVGGGVRIKSLI